MAKVAAYIIISMMLLYPGLVSYLCKTASWTKRNIFEIAAGLRSTETSLMVSVEIDSKPMFWWKWYDHFWEMLSDETDFPLRQTGCSVMSCDVKHAMSCYVISCDVMWYYVMWCYLIRCNVMLRHAMWCCVLSCNAMLCDMMSVLLCDTMWYCYIMWYCYVIICNVMWRDVVLREVLDTLTHPEC